MTTISFSVDRIENGIAVLIGEDGKKKINLPVSQLPKGCKEGDWLKAELRGDGLTNIAKDPEAAKRAKARIATKLDALRNRQKK